MCLASRILGYIKSFDIRRIDKLEVELELFSQPNSEGSDQEIFAADFRQVLKLVDPVINDYDKLENQDQSLCQEVCTPCALWVPLDTEWVDKTGLKNREDKLDAVNLRIYMFLKKWDIFSWMWYAPFW